MIVDLKKTRECEFINKEMRKKNRWNLEITFNLKFYVVLIAIEVLCLDQTKKTSISSKTAVISAICCIFR